MCENKEKVEIVNKSRYCVLWEDHPKNICNMMCSLMENQSLVDVTISCNAYTVHVHKCMLAASSIYFREQLEQNPNTEQIVFNGLDHLVIKSIIEFIYCGETIILDEHVQALMTAASFFQIRGLKTLLKAEKSYNAEHEIIIPAPIFLSKKPKVAGIIKPLPMEAQNQQSHSLNNYDNSYMFRRVKRKYVRSEADKACAQEANASRLALEALQRELENAGDPRFEIEESCVETTVESFIPSEGTDMQYLNQITTIPIQVVNYGDLNDAVIETRTAILDTNDPKLITINKSCLSSETEVLNNRAVQLTPEQMTSEKIKQFLGSDVPANVEIMFKTSEGNFVSITDEVLENITEGTLQYQVIDENGEAGEIRELQVHQKIQGPAQNFPLNDFNTSAMNVNPLQEEDLMPNQMVNPRSLQFDNLTNLTGSYDDENMLIDKSYGKNNELETINLVREQENQESVSEVYKAYRRILEPNYSPKCNTNVSDIFYTQEKLPEIDDHQIDSLMMTKDNTELGKEEKIDGNICNEKFEQNVPSLSTPPPINPTSQSLFSMNDVQRAVENFEDEGLKEEIGCAEIFPEQNLCSFDANFNENGLMENDSLSSVPGTGNFLNLENPYRVLDLTKHHVETVDLSNSTPSSNLEEDGGGDCSNSMKKVSRTKKKLSKVCELSDNEKNELKPIPRKTRFGNREEINLKANEESAEKTDASKNEKICRRVTPNRRSKQIH